MLAPKLVARSIVIGVHLLSTVKFSILNVFTAVAPAVSEHNFKDNAPDAPIVPAVCFIQKLICWYPLRSKVEVVLYAANPVVKFKPTAIESEQSPSLMPPKASVVTKDVVISAVCAVHTVLPFPLFP